MTFRISIKILRVFQIIHAKIYIYKRRYLKSEALPVTRISKEIFNALSSLNVICSGGVSSHHYGSGVTFCATSKYCIHFPHELTATPVTQHDDRHIADRALLAHRSFTVAVDAATATADTHRRVISTTPNLFDGFDRTLTSFTNIVFSNTFYVIAVRLYYIILRRHKGTESLKVGEL